MIVRFVDIGVPCLPSLFRCDCFFVDIGGIVDHHSVEVIVRFVDVGENC